MELITENDIRAKEYLEDIRRWVQEESYPEVRTGDTWLMNFLTGCKLNLQKTKDKLKCHRDLRKLTPEIFDNRDPFQPEIQEILDRGIILPLESHDVLYVMVRWKNSDCNKTPFPAILKLAFMILDIFLQEYEGCMIAGQGIIDDFDGFSLRYLQHLTPSIIRNMFTVLFKAYPLRPQGIYCLNAPWFIHTVINFSKSFLTEKLKSRIHVYGRSTSENLFEHVPRSAIPKDYGGDGPSCDSIRDTWKAKVESYRDWFLEENLTSSERKKKINKQIFLSERSLEID